MSPIHPKTSRSRLRPYCCSSCWAAAAPPNAPATVLNSVFSPGPTFGAPNAAQESPGSSETSGVSPVPRNGANALSALVPGPLMSVSNAIRSPSANSAPASGSSLSTGKIERICSYCCLAWGSAFSACSKSGLRST